MMRSSDVLNLIDPVDPDSLQYLDGVWVAKWCPPVLGRY